MGFQAKEGWKGWDEAAAYIPQSEIRDMIIELRSLSYGVGTFAWRFDHLHELTGREAECAAWVGTELVPLSEGRFAFDAGRPADPWRVRTADGAADLTMTPGAVHSEQRELLVARSRFVQPCGAWSGSIALEGRAPLVIARALGVTEDQDITW